MGLNGKKNKNIVAALVLVLLAIAALLAVILVKKGWQQAKGSKEAGVLSDPVIKASSVMVECGDQVGCGNIYEVRKDTAVIVTARHILEGNSDAGNFAESGEEPKVSDQINVTFRDGRVETASLLKEDPALDVAFLEVGASLPEGMAGIFAGADAAFVSDFALMPGTEIYLRNALTDQVYAGTVAIPSVYSEDFGTEMILCYCVVDEGMSGTGLFDAEGNYLGMLLGSTDEGEAVCLEAARIRSAAP